MKKEVHKRKVDTPDESLYRISDVVDSIKKGEDQFRRKTRHLNTRVAKCSEVDRWVFGAFCFVNSIKLTIYV